MDYHGEFEVVWQYEWRNRTWVDFATEQCEAAERAFQDDEVTEVTVQGDTGNVAIVLDFIRMAQKGIVERKIRRVAVLSHPW